MVPVEPVTLRVTAPESYQLLGFRAVIGAPCPNCHARIWAVMESIMKGRQRLYREAWRLTLETEDFTPFEDVPDNEKNQL